ncbi:class I SAM-dependent methyltransferase [Paenibacillus assamensis]|uniref:class I SAM-dependent methyltransferase n=1 Tax=Paenibacillus assamensis TaxID=311244 RepID=UPI0006851BC0|nr:class I SAM-dependent methyltransferase [Paenibacillus assamensis]
MLDTLLREQSSFTWNTFYSDRSKAIPFFVNAPDENLVQYVHQRQLPAAGRVLELGCGPGRNAIYLAKQGYEVDAVDLSSEALQWAKDRAQQQQVDVNFICRNIFELDIEEAAYDIIYDSGCMHHIAPHRRIDYVRLVNRALKSGGMFAVTCFVENGVLGGAEISDWEVYRQRSLRGGLGFNSDKLKTIFKDLHAVEVRKMLDMEKSSDRFGNSGLWAALFQKKER